MIGFARRVGIAIGSLVAAALSMGLLWGLTQWTVTSLGTPIDIGGPPSSGTGFLLLLGTFLTGGLIYRDILRRDRRT